MNFMEMGDVRDVSKKTWGIKPTILQGIYGNMSGTLTLSTRTAITWRIVQKRGKAAGKVQKPHHTGDRMGHMC